jgi:phosphoribosylanthranilate isomerase
MAVAVKICGLTEEAGLAAAVAAGADYVGFVFFPKSPRVLSVEAAARLLSRVPVPSTVKKVGLFVRPRLDDIARVLAEVPLDILQLYETTAALRREIAARFGLPLWQAVGVSEPADLPQALDTADALLLDAKPPPGAERPGGNARAFAWEMLRGWRAPGPWILAGGLTPENVAAAVRMSGAQAVDVSSGVESAPGRKDPERIRRFIAEARSASA